VGSTQIRNITVGIVAATLHPLDDRIARGTFRSDLYYRLAQVVLSLPPLRERADDLPLLVAGLWVRHVPAVAPPAFLFRPPILPLLQAYPWPGNVRELDRVVATISRRLRTHGPQWVLSTEELRAILRLGSSPSATAGRSSLPTASEVRRAIAASSGNRSVAADVLGISRSCLYRILGPDNKA
jgi:transcriptional regulator with PAS, ATPase and Fis domain